MFLICQDHIHSLDVKGMTIMQNVNEHGDKLFVLVGIDTFNTRSVIGIYKRMDVAKYIMACILKEIVVKQTEFFDVGTVDYKYR